MQVIIYWRFTFVDTGGGSDRAEVAVPNDLETEATMGQSVSPTLCCCEVGLCLPLLVVWCSDSSYSHPQQVIVYEQQPLKATGVVQDHWLGPQTTFN